MNQNLVIDAIYDVLNTNKNSITDNIQHQGQERHIKAILKSVLTEPKETYAINIGITSVNERFVPAGNTTRGKSVATYFVELHVIDFAYPQVEDANETPFETMHGDFMLVIDRLVKLIKDDTTSFTSGGARFILLENNDIRVDNRTAWYDVQQTSYPILYSVILFRLVDYCADSSLLE